MDFHFPPYLASVGMILLALLAGVLSPGPSFVQVARIAVARSRADGLAVAVGLGLGAVVFAVLALAGLHAVLAAVPPLYTALKLLGGLYLLWMAWSIWRGAKQPLALAGEAAAVPARRSLWQSFRLGLVTQLSNPKCAVVYGSVFAALLPAHFPLAASLLVALGVLLMETGWYVVVALVLSSAAPRAAYLRSKMAVDRTAAGVMGLLGGRLVLTASQV
ncbi:LysE family translocator [Variovorax terrae]|uniref:LysE family translocator n=1 Tax=Variovorax terrae TaxID=2923278 RepID=A0A9X1VV30_9BURK|nr:LysE family transporter [Variovorax terrae]MCJ0763932.1 LysE family translocator [Variovorax terrae]